MFLDIFGKSYEFNLKKDEKRKRTYLGVCLSILIILLSLSYLSIQIIIIIYLK